MRHASSSRSPVTPRTIVDSVAPVYRAADAAGVRRIVYLSTASVHGQAPPRRHRRDDTAVRSPAASRTTTPKSAPSASCCNCARERLVEIVVLRPGIVYGPRSHGRAVLPTSCSPATASLVDGGHGICNAIYVDNVVHAIRLALDGSGRRSAGVPRSATPRRSPGAICTGRSPKRSASTSTCCRRRLAPAASRVGRWRTGCAVRRRRAALLPAPRSRRTQGRVHALAATHGAAVAGAAPTRDARAGAAAHVRVQAAVDQRRDASSVTSPGRPSTTAAAVPSRGSSSPATRCSVGRRS